MRTKVWAAAAVLGAAALFLGIRAFDPSAAPDTPSESVIQHLRDRHEVAAMVLPFDSIDDLLDNVRYAAPGRDAGPLTDAVVVGRVTEVTKGMGFYVEGDDGPAGIEIDYDDPRAQWRTVHATVEVRRLLSGQLDGDEVPVGLAFGNGMPFERIRRDLLSYESLLLFLQRGLPVFDYDAAVYGTVMDGALLGFVAPDGTISLPVLEDSEEAEFTKDARTVEALARARESGPRRVRLDASGAAVGEAAD